MKKSFKPIGPFCKPNTLSMLDGRRKEARFLQEKRDELIAHVGGNPSVVQRGIIERAAVMALRVAIIDARAPDGNMNDTTAKEYLCWSNALVRYLRTLGLESAPPKPLSVAQLLRNARDGGCAV